METLLVDLGERSYPIELGWDSLDDLGPYLARLIPSKNCMLISNAAVYRLYGEQVKLSLQAAGRQVGIYLIPEGETTKSLATVAKIYEALVTHDMDRNCPLLALGGGIVGDVAGFAAATYLRGIPFVQIPTTLLAQVDSSVGGKVGVNLPAGKNLVGCFYQPRVVWVDLSTLASLPSRELRAGLAEVVKYGVIQDPSFFQFLEENKKEVEHLPPELLLKIVRLSCQIKARIVGRDERELGMRAILNYGHTFGHVLETLSNYDYKHGEAVAAGMVAATKIALGLGVCREHDLLARQQQLLSALGLPIDWPPELERQQMIAVLKRDKKSRSGAIRMVLPVKLGETTVARIDFTKLEQILAYL